MADTILITGSSGTVGTGLAKSLVENDYNVVGVDKNSNQWSEQIDHKTILGDLRQESTFKDLPRSVDLIVHLAANARVHKLVQNPDLARDNFETTHNILEYARNVSADFIFASSREVYGNNGNVIYSEDDTYVDECESPYTASKIGGESLVKSYDNCYDINTCTVRFSNVYGKYDSSDRVIPLFIAQAKQGEDLTVYGDEKVLDFTYIDDCVDGVYSIIENFEKTKGTTFNIASGNGASLVEVAQAITNQIDNSDVSLNIEENRTGEVSRFVADISKANKILDYTPKYNLQDGISSTIDWYLERPYLLDQIRN